MPQRELSRTSVCFGLALLASVTAAGEVHAQTASRPPSAAAADPLDPAAPAPSVEYRSALAGYRALAEEELLPWPETNRTVERIGGWRAYAREAQQPAQEGQDAGMHGGHAGHGMKK